MKTYLPLLQKSSLFNGIGEEDIQKLCTCLSAREKTIPRETFVFHVEDRVTLVYLVLTGSMHIIDEDFWGNRSIIETLNAYTLFGEAYVLSKAEKHLVSVIAAEDSTILEIDPTRLFETCPKECSCHISLMQNTLQLLSKKIIRLTEKLGHISKRTLHEKIMSYLSQSARQAQSSSFDIPYSRQQLADYLCVDRSALSHELSRLRNLGLIQYRKNHFDLFLESAAK